MDSPGKIDEGFSRTDLTMGCRDSAGDGLSRQDCRCIAKVRWRMGSQGRTGDG